MTVTGGFGAIDKRPDSAAVPYRFIPDRGVSTITFQNLESVSRQDINWVSVA